MHSAYHASFWIALLVGIASGSIGPFILLRRMALVGDALSHVALPGIALALVYGLDPFYGVVVFLIGAAFLIFWLEGRSRIPPDAIVGLLFTASLAVGILIIPNADIIESLFGAFPVQPLPFQESEGEPQQAAPEESAAKKTSTTNNPFSCDDPTAQ